MPAPRLILASASPRRQSLLREAGYAFEVDPAEVDESSFLPALLPGRVAEYLAQLKADAVALRHTEDVVLGADTVVAFGDALLGKPADADDARRMLDLLSGTTHLCITGVAVVQRVMGVRRVRRATSAVRMRSLTRAEIDAYVATGSWEGKAGGYGIQDEALKADPFVTRAAGSHTNIVGLPMELASEMLAEVGVFPNPREA
jgi:septum formation protein